MCVWCAVWCVCRAKVVKHNQKLKQKQKDQKLQRALEASDGDKKAKKKRNAAAAALPSLVSGESLDDDVYRDQGFVRPRLLILCPFRHTARKIVDMMAQILGPNTSISGYDKFEVDYADPNDEDDPFAIYNEHKRKNAKRQRGPIQKPADWDAVFKGNVDDDFKVGGIDGAQRSRFDAGWLTTCLCLCLCPCVAM